MLRTALLVSLLSIPRLAFAFVVEHDASGSPIHWPGGTVAFLIDPTSRDVDAADVLAAAQRAASHWEQAAPVTITLTAEAGHGTPGYDAANPSQNHSEIFFLDDEWDYDELVIAETLVTSDATTHQILDTDVLINGAQHHFGILPDGSQPGDGLVDDLESALTHELGHALGMAHNPDLTTATMYPSATVGEVGERILSSDDVGGVRSLYDTASSAADPTTGCSSVTGSGLAPFAGLLILGLCRRARRGRASLAWAAAVTVAFGGVGAARAEEPAIELSVGGDVQSVQAQWRGGLIVSHVTVGVRSCRRGTCPDAVELEMVGGTLDGVEQHLSESAIPRVGESIEADLARNRHGTLRPVGPVVIRRQPSAP